MRVFFPSTINKVVEASDDEVLTSPLDPASVRVEIHVTDGFPGAEPTRDQRIPVGVDDVDVLGVALVQPHRRFVTFEQGSRRVQPWSWGSFQN